MNIKNIPPARTEYMQQIMNLTYPMVAVEAIYGGFEGSWERLIAKRLEWDAQRDRSEAVLLLEAAGGDPMKAAFIVTGSQRYIIKKMAELGQPLTDVQFTNKKQTATFTAEELKVLGKVLKTKITQ